MSKKKVLAMAVLSAVASVGFVMSASAEEHMSTDVAPVVVESSGIVNANDTYDGKIIRTGGDVTVVTAAEIEKKAYTSVIDAIKKIPGVDVQQTGYRGFEYEYGSYQDTISINGNRRVVILLDGKRLTNEANGSANSGSYTKAQVFNMIGIENVEQIEVIKGASAMAYGTDCSGGVINIITKKGDRNNMTIGAAYGSWGRQNYKLTSAGKEKKIGWILSYDKDKRNDSKYVDHEYKKTRTYKGSSFDEDNVFAKVDYEIDNRQSVELTYMYKHANDEYPIMAPDYSAQSAMLGAIASATAAGSWDYPNGMWDSQKNGSLDCYTNFPRTDARWNRYHRWWYVYGAGTYTKNTNRNFDVKYNIKGDDGIDSYVRLFHNENRYFMDRYRPDFGNYSVPSSSVAANGKKLTNAKQYTWAKEQSKGVNVRWGKKLDDHNTVYTGFDYSKNSSWENFYASQEYMPATNSYGPLKKGTIKSVKRDVWDAFVQDKISLGKLTVTPGVRYNHYAKSTGTFNDRGADSFSHATFGLFADYELAKGHNIYASWSQVYNAPYASNEASAKNKLNAEDGDAYTLGYSGKSGKSTYGVDYTALLMDNTYDGVLSEIAGHEGEYSTAYTNVKARTYSIGAHYGYKFDDNWSAKLGYNHARTTYSKNSGTWAGITSVDDMRHSLTYNNRYNASVDYEIGKFSTGVDFTLYSGMNTKFFTNNRFFLVDLHANYKLSKKASIYAQINNLTNRAYETKAVAAEGPGALPMEGRNFLIGCNYSF